jgi:hypothetical protein
MRAARNISPTQSLKEKWRHRMNSPTTDSPTTIKSLSTMLSASRKLFGAGLCAALLTLASTANAYVLLGNGNDTPQKWGDLSWGTGATITWSFMDEGVGSNLAGYTGTNTLGQLRTQIDTSFGAGAFDAVVNNVFATWSAAADIHFVQVADSGAAFNGSATPDIRIGAFAFDDPCCGAAGYGPPGSTFADPLAGDLVLNNLAGFTIYPYTEGTAYQAGDWQNDLESLLLHEVGHTLGLGHSDDAGAIMCVLSTCNEILNLQRTLGADDIAGIQYIYGAPAAVPVPAAAWLFGSGLLGLTGIARRKSAA